MDFRVLVPSREFLVERLPCRIFFHPNYVAVFVKLFGATLTVSAPVSDYVSIIGFNALMHGRVAIEDRGALLRQAI